LGNSPFPPPFLNINVEPSLSWADGKDLQQTLFDVKNPNEDARELQPQQGSMCPLPTRRYLTQKEAADWLGVCVDTFKSFQIPYYELGDRGKRWDVDEIRSFVQTRRRDSARTPANHQQKEGQKCVSSKGRAHRIGGSHGMAKTASDIAEVLDLPIRS
jgi:hypothetical protein